MSTVALLESSQVRNARDETVPVADVSSPLPRFTIDGDAALERHLAVTCDRIAAGLRGLLPSHKLEAVLLGGGYGRGEGGVLRTPDGDRPYNDLEFYVCLRGNRHLNQRIHGRALHVLGEILTPQAGIDVEFHLTSLRDLATADVSMFSYDLLCGHRCIIGSEAQLRECRHHLQAEAIPLTEATRLLMNRCSGLLFAAERLDRPVFTPGDADFVARNIAKAQLGAGDAVLTAHQQYHWSVRTRQDRLTWLAQANSLLWVGNVLEHHRTGVEFKLHPMRSTESREQLSARHAEVSETCREVWLWLEGRRLGTSFRSTREYADTPRALWPEGMRLRNHLVAAKVFGWSAAVQPSASRHPRGRVLRALPLLLWSRNDALSRATLARLQSELRTSATTFPALVAAYHAVWAQVN